MKKAHWNKKVAKNRGLEWRKKLLAGRLDVQRNPTHLRLNRIKKNKTQIELAEQIGMSYTTYGAVESGRRPVAESKALKIASTLGLPFEKAFEKTDHPNRYVAVRE